MVVLDLRCVFLGGRERENIPIRDGVGGSFTVYPGISVEKSLWKSLTKKKIISLWCQDSGSLWILDTYISYHL